MKHRFHWLWLLALAAVAGLVLGSGNLRALFAEAIGKVTPGAVLATLPGQIAASLLCGWALWALKPGVGFRGSLASRLLRDAASNLLVLFPGLGAIIGARALVLAGGTTRAAISASVLDKFAETLAQVPYIALAVVVLWQGWNPQTPDSVFLLAIPVLAMAAWLAWLWLNSNHALARRLREELGKLLNEALRQRSGLPLSTFLHFLAWIMGGVQVWMAAHALGADVTFYEAMAIESAAYAGRVLLFFVPAGLLAQEAGLVAAALVFGVTAPHALALALVLRLRDVVFGLPLVAWPLFEMRHARRNTARE